MLTISHGSCSNEVPPSVAPALGVELAGDPSAFAACCNLPTRPKVMMVDDEKLNLYVVAEYLKPSG